MGAAEHAVAARKRKSRDFRLPKVPRAQALYYGKPNGDHDPFIVDHKVCVLRFEDIHQPHAPEANAVMKGIGSQSQIVTEIGSATALAGA